SCGLFSTNELNGDSTVWMKEGANSIGNVIIDMVDARQTDGFIAIGTHGNGVYSAYYNPSAGIEESNGTQLFQVGNVFPTPVKDVANAELNVQTRMTLQAILYSNAGKLVKVFEDQTIKPGKQQVAFQMGELPVGVYYLAFRDGKKMVVKKVVKARW
ncbi:MAG: T9SS type A sorting domain-containing protein, partial [Bacteroidota bacterium]